MQAFAGRRQPVKQVFGACAIDESVICAHQQPVMIFEVEEVNLYGQSANLLEGCPNVVGFDFPSPYRTHLCMFRNVPLGLFDDVPP